MILQIEHNILLQDTMSIIKSINPERGILICNGDNINGVNGRMYENFKYYDPNSVPAAYDISSLIHQNGIRISEVHKDKCQIYSSLYNSTLAGYLIGAYNGSYYACTESWYLPGGWDTMWQNPDYNKPLGKPLYNATFNSTTQVYHREFEKGVNVWLDYKWDYPCIQWSDKSITGSTDACNKYIYNLE